MLPSPRSSVCNSNDRLPLFRSLLIPQSPGNLSFPLRLTAFALRSLLSSLAESKRDVIQHAATKTMRFSGGKTAGVCAVLVAALVGQRCNADDRPGTSSVWQPYATNSGLGANLLPTIATRWPLLPQAQVQFCQVQHLPSLCHLHYPRSRSRSRPLRIVHRPQRMPRRPQASIRLLQRRRRIRIYRQRPTHFRRPRAKTPRPGHRLRAAPDHPALANSRQL